MILVINCGSSSIKFACFNREAEVKRVLSGEITKIGSAAGRLVLQEGYNNHVELSKAVDVSSFSMAIMQLECLLAEYIKFSDVEYIGHRICQGLEHDRTEIITDSLVKYLLAISKYDPEHLPYQIRLVEYFMNKHPVITQYACYDTEFHKTIAPVARLLPLPKKFRVRGFHRYGFHGLSYEYLMTRLVDLVGEKSANRRIVIAHLGNGSSLSAIRNGICLDTTMSFTPGSGIPMSTRSGDLDPGLICAIMNEENITPDEFITMINHNAGLLGISETTGSVQSLLELEKNDSRASEAVDFFCYNIKKAIGALATALGGMDILIFSGGIGENSPIIRSRICSGLEFLGVTINEELNQQNNISVSDRSSRVDTFVIHSDEAWMVATKILKITQIKQIS